MQTNLIKETCEESLANAPRNVFHHLLHVFRMHGIFDKGRMAFMFCKTLIIRKDLKPRWNSLLTGRGSSSSNRGTLFYPPGA